MEEMAYLWSHQENHDELKLKIHYTALELEAVKAKSNEEINKNTESVKQLLYLLKLVCQERDEARDQIQKLLNNCFVKSAKANSSIAESNSLSNAYNHCSSHVTSPDHFSNIHINTSFVQDYAMLSNGFNATEMDHATLMMESMIKGKALPQKGNLLKAVIEAGPLLQTLFVTNPLPNSGSLLQPRFFCDYDMNSSNFQGKMMATSFPTASNFGPVEKRQKFQ